MWTRALFVAALGLAAGGAVGCATERAPINRVQANALAKSFFVGADLKDISDDPEFYMRGTVIDVGYGAAQDGLFTSTYAQPISRIKWEVTEGFLNARLAYERIKDSDGKGTEYNGTKKKTSNDGQIVASYRIQSHFDIRRSYNPQTGEESNVIEENQSDRSWNEREYFRVDWSQNFATDAYDYDTLSMLGLFGSIQYEPLSYTVLDPADENAPHFDPEQGYFDVTNKAFAKPALLDLSSLGWGIDTFPACMLPGEFAGGTDPYGNCNPVEITIRQSFKRVVDKDYEPMDVDGYRFQALGNFTTEYKGYERNYGMLDNRWFRFADRYNIWERSHFYGSPAEMKDDVQCDTQAKTAEMTGDPAADPNRDSDKNGTVDECEEVTAKSGFGGSKCDVFKGKCTLPYRARKSVTIPWYLAGNTDEELFEATDWAVQEWDLSFKATINSTRYAECMKTGGTVDQCAKDYPMWSGQQDDIDDASEITRDLYACYRTQGWGNAGCISDAQNAANALPTTPDANKSAIGSVIAMDPVIVLCHNPVTDKDHKACGAPGLAPRLGDIRYNLVLDIDKPQQPSAWGIMVDADDPISGEKVAASINIWTHVTDLASQQLVDLVRYINGEIKIQDITNGKYIHDWAQASKLGSGATPTMSDEEVTSRLAAMAHVDEKAFAQIQKNGVPAGIQNVIDKGKFMVADVAARADIASPQQAQVQARMSQARGTSVEATLINKPMLEISGIKHDVPLQGPFADAASPLAMNNPKLLSQLRNMRENALAARHACIIGEAPEFSAVAPIADIMKKKFPIGANETALQAKDRYTKMWHYIRRRYHYAVLGHEMGHSVGLRHNFVSTAASLFYRPQYWQLRTANGATKTECTAQVADGSKCVGPRWFDPMTEDEQSQLIWMFMQSTVMDYPGDVSQDTIGLGVTDFAATRFFYGDVVSVYKDPSYKAGSKIGVGIAVATDTFGGLSGIKYGVKGTQGATDFHYSQLQKNYNVIQNCQNFTPAPPKSWNQDIDGVWDETLDGHHVKIGGQYSKCRQQEVDYTTWDQLRAPDPVKELANGFYRGGPNVDPQGRLRVPHAFATDHWADTGNVSVFRHDNGADAYEQVTFLISTQENRHIFDNYRRNRTSFNVRAAADRSFSRYNEKLLGIAGGIGFYGTIYQDLATGMGLSFDTLFPEIVAGSLHENMLAASVAMDHFTRELSRPEAGEHYFRDKKYNDPVLHSNNDTDDYGAGTDFSSFGGNKNSDVLVVVPNGATGFFKDIGFGGKLVENTLADNMGDYDSNFTESAGSYYEKINAAILLSESEDRFISSSRRDFYDARFRAVGMADVLPDGFRRIMANALTGDRTILAPRIAADAQGNPVVDKTADDSRDPDAKKYPKGPMGWTSWWPASGPVSCFPQNGNNLCADVAGTITFGNNPPAQTVAVDPQIGWEVQKFLIAWTLAYIPADQKSQWIDQMRIYRLGANSDPAFDARIEWQDPYSGQTYYAKTYGKECLFASGTTRATCEGAGGKWVQKGIAARVLEWANDLTSHGFALDTTNFAATAEYPAGFNAKGRAMYLTQPDGTPVIASDPAVKVLNAAGQLVPTTTCDNNVDTACTPLNKYDNHYAYDVANYKTIPDYLWEVMVRYGLGSPDQLGVFPN
jgi:hypothetical protein